MDHLGSSSLYYAKPAKIESGASVIKDYGRYDCKAIAGAS